MRITTKEAATNISRRIIKAKLAKHGGLDVEFEQTIKFLNDKEEEIELTSDASLSCKNFPHPDLVNAFNMMRAHLAIITDMPEAIGLSLHDLDDKEDLIEKFKVSSFSIGGSGESEGVTLSGGKKLNGGKILNLSTPFTKFDDENDPYEYHYELKSLIDHACDEVNEYLDGKIAPNAQQEIPFGESDDDHDLE